MRKLESFYLAVLTLLSAAPAHADALVLWNKLGSAQEILNSEFGPDGTVVRNPIRDIRPGRYALRLCLLAEPFVQQL